MRFFCALLLISQVTGLIAKEGDTTRVRTHDKVLIQTDPSIGHTEYPGWGVFPAAGKQYRKVYAELTMQCPPGMTCGEWDYLNYIFIGKRHHGEERDTLDWEIMRFITAYGLQFNQQWKHTWKFDISDFANLFHDSIEIWYQHTGYEAKNGRGWLITLDFTFIEGPSTRRVAKIVPLLRKSVGYGNDSLFDANVPEDTFTLGYLTKEIRYKIIQTGHGMDGNDGCGEFCAKKRYIVFDNKTIDTSLVWRDDCGANAVFPQGGTWIYDRAAWCPGAEVREYNLDIPVEPGSTHTLDMDMESYTGGGNYMISLYLIEYANRNFRNDISMEEIIRPSDELQYQRLNPECGKPLLRVRNNGSENIKDVLIEYGWKGFKYQRFHWHGDLKFNEIADIELPALRGYANTGNVFFAQIVWVNNRVDNYAGNNKIQSLCKNPLPQHVKDLVVIIRTNKAASENYYTLKSSDGTVILNKNNFANSTTYRDTVHLSDGCYSLNLMDDGEPPSQYALNEDGLGWWANTYDGNGLFQIRDASNNVLIKNFGIDFGSGIQYNFTVGNAPSPHAQVPAIKVYPNPVQYDLLLDLGANSSETLQFQLINATGKILIQETRTGYLDALQFVDVSSLSSGVYFIKIQHGSSYLSQKIMIH